MFNASYSDVAHSITSNGFAIIPNAIGQAARLLDLLLVAPLKHSAFTTKEFAASQKRKGDTVLLHVPYLASDFTELISSLGLIEYIEEVSMRVNQWSGREFYYVSQYTARNPTRALPMHRDTFWPFREQAEFFQILIPLENVSISNCTQYLPGSHLKDNPNLAVEPKDLICSSGDVVILDSRLYHGSKQISVNSTESRWMLILTLSPWWIRPIANYIGVSHDGTKPPYPSHLSVMYGSQFRCPSLGDEFVNIAPS